jgi:hypothetical protein
VLAVRLAVNIQSLGGSHGIQVRPSIISLAIVWVSVSPSYPPPGEHGRSSWCRIDLWWLPRCLSLANHGVLSAACAAGLVLSSGFIESIAPMSTPRPACGSPPSDSLLHSRCVLGVMRASLARCIPVLGDSKCDTSYFRVFLLSLGIAEMFRCSPRKLGRIFHVVGPVCDSILTTAAARTVPGGSILSPPACLPRKATATFCV